MALGGSSDIFTCALCLDDLKDPRALPCLHTFCTACMRPLVKVRIPLHITVCTRLDINSKLGEDYVISCLYCFINMKCILTKCLKEFLIFRLIWTNGKL